MADFDKLERLTTERYGEVFSLGNADDRDLLARHAEQLANLAARRSHRRFEDKPVSVELIRALAAVAFAAPSKSDLQQRDLIIVDDAAQLAALKACVGEQDWTAGIGRMLVVCANNRRQRQIHDMRGHAFANDHIDALFNAAVDAGILLQAFMTAAETVGLGCCPISAIRDRSGEVSDILELPDHVFAVAGLAVGWPAHEGRLSYRLPLGVTVHVDRFSDTGIADQVTAYDRRRAAAQPYRQQREPERFGELDQADYGWSEDKARQYATAQRTDFGAFLVRKGFTLT